MASVCIPQTNFQQQHHFQLLNGNIMLLQQQQHHHQQQQLPPQYVNKQQQQPIAPAPAAKVLGNSNLQNIQPSMTSGSLGPLVNKKKYIYNNLPYGGEQQLPSVARRNARERNRVKQVNNGFSNLRQHLPQSVINALSNGGRGASKKLSKVDTLRIAVEYIRGLKDLLDDGSSPAADDSSAPFILDECSNDGSNYDDFPTLDSPVESQYQPTTTHTYHSEASASPTPSFSDSDISIGGANYLQPLKQEEPQQQQQLPAQQMQFKFEPFEQNNYNQQLASEEQPDDEELLDYISLWQQQ